jgi:hypothetical protein
LSIDNPVVEVVITGWRLSSTLSAGSMPAGRNQRLRWVVYPPIRTAQFDRKRNFFEPEKSLKLLWERFPTAIKSVGPTSLVVVENHSHPEKISN